MALSASSVKMRSGVTAGLTPQQLLDRRRAQNKLAQRRFREKAKQVRTPGNNVQAHSATTSASVSSASSPHSSPPAQSSQLHTTISSPQISDSEQSPASFSAFQQTSEKFVPQLVGPEQSPVAASFSLSDDPASYLSKSTAPQEPTYASLASRSQDALPQSAVPGLRGDPFLTSLPLPSPSLLTEATYRLFASSSFQPGFDFNASSSFRPPVATPTSVIPGGLGLNKNGGDFLERRSSLSFEQYLRSQTPSGPKGESSEASSYFSDVATAVTPPLSAAPSDSSQEHNVHTPEQQHIANPDSTATLGDQQKAFIDSTLLPMVMLNSMSYASALQLMVQRSDKGMPACSDRASSTAAKSLALWQHLRASSPSLRAHLTQDNDIVWSSLPDNMQPTMEQQRYPHHRCIDLGLPWASVRSRLLELAQTDRICLGEFLLDILLSLVLPEQQPSFYVYGDDPHDPESWEVSPSFAAKWSGLFDQSILRRSNWWRRQRGLSPLSLPTPSGNVSECVRQRLGTGSMDESSRIWTTAFPSLPLSAHL